MNTTCSRRASKPPFWLLIHGLQLTGFTFDEAAALDWVNADPDRTAWLITHHRTLRSP